VTFQYNFTGLSISFILDQIRIDSQFRFRYGKYPFLGIIVSFEAPGILPFTKPDQIIPSPNWSLIKAGTAHSLQKRNRLFIFLCQEWLLWECLCLPSSIHSHR
jgi:hypothetical protein